MRFSREEIEAKKAEIRAMLRGAGRVGATREGKMYQANIPGDPHAFFFLGTSDDLGKAHRQKVKCWYRDGRVWAECVLEKTILAPFRVAVLDSAEGGGREYGMCGFGEPLEIGDVVEVTLKVEGKPM